MTLYRPLMNKFLSDISVIVATSPQYLSSSETLRPYRGKSRVIPIGIDEESYPEVPDELMSSLEQTHGSGFFFFVGVLRYYKCLDVLLKASADQDFKVIIAGEGPLEDTLKKEAKAIGLDNVQFVGRISDEEKIAFIKLSRAIVFPSFIRAESFGITLLEGAMYEKPLVTADVESGMNYVNIDRVTGLVVEGNSPLALREALVELDRDPKLAEALGAGARERYDELFSGEVMGKNYAALYQELVTGTLS
jgi:rhamnosyl/mannosyltransferase